jgi:predicted aldo/keto reductase-like oxidoreductase
LPTAKKYFEEMLCIFGYVDIAMLFNVDTNKEYDMVFADEYLDYAMSLKQKGDIKHIGISTHRPEIAIKAIETGVPEVLFFSLNPAFDMLPPDEDAVMLMFDGFDPNLMHGIDPIRAKLYNLCEQKNIGITAMKVLGGGKFISSELTPFSMPLTVQQCIHFALTRPAVTSVMLGCQTPAEVAEAMKYYTVDDNNRDYTKFLGTVDSSFKGQCVYCSHCQPCPANIDIATVIKFLDIAKLSPETLAPSLCSDYKSLSATGSDCIHCGSCEDRCSFGVKIMDNMTEVSKIFGK